MWLQLNFYIEWIKSMWDICFFPDVVQDILLHYFVKIQITIEHLIYNLLCPACLFDRLTFFFHFLGCTSYFFTKKNKKIILLFIIVILGQLSIIKCARNIYKKVINLLLYPNKNLKITYINKVFFITESVHTSV